jgi:AAA family ATP:ADP antiporter
MVKTFSNDALTKNVGGSSFDGLRNIISNKDVRLIAIYSWFFTFLMTIQWIAAIPIINDYSELAPERIILFSNIEQLVTPLTFFVQTFLTYFVISKYGIKLIFIIYGVLFSLVFILYGFFPSVAIVVLCQTFLRVFEYGFNKPAREIGYSQLRKGDRYKSTVFIDTFITRFGDLSGSIFMGIGKVIFISVTYLPIVAIPLAFIHTYVARKIFLRNTFKDL